MKNVSSVCVAVIHTSSSKPDIGSVDSASSSMYENTPCPSNGWSLELVLALELALELELERERELELELALELGLELAPSA